MPSDLHFSETVLLMEKVFLNWIKATPSWREHIGVVVEEEDKEEKRVA